jgi:hypothetical protein
LISVAEMSRGRCGHPAAASRSAGEVPVLHLPRVVEHVVGASPDRELEGNLLRIIEFDDPV